MFLAMFQLRKYLYGKIVKAKDHVQFYIKFNSESFKICYTASLYHTHQYVGAFKLIYFVIFFTFCVLLLLLLRKMWLGKMLKFKSKWLFPIKFSSEFLQIFYSDSLYHTYPYVSDYKLIYI